MDEQAGRVASAEALGAAKRGEGMLLGALAMVPLVLLAAAAWLAPAWRDLAAKAAIVWSGALLAFLAGVRRGLTFSEAGGGGTGDKLALLAVFALATLVLAVPSAPLAIMQAMLGLTGVAIGDALAARRRQAPRYFAGFRPLQMAAGVAALAGLLAALLTD